MILVPNHNPSKHHFHAFVPYRNTERLRYQIVGFLLVLGTGGSSTPPGTLVLCNNTLDREALNFRIRAQPITFGSGFLEGGRLMQMCLSSADIWWDHNREPWTLVWWYICGFVSRCGPPGKYKKVVPLRPLAIGPQTSNERARPSPT